MADSGNQKGKRMWPSLETASRVADIANFFFIGSLVIGVVATILIVWMAGVKEGYWDTSRTEAAERISALGAETAKANARAEEARLELARFKAPRDLNQEQQAKFVAAMKPFSGQQFAGMVAGSVSDARPLWVLLDKLLREAGWVRMPPWGASAGEPPAGIPVAPNEGVSVYLPADELFSTGVIASALSSALNAEGVKSTPFKSAGPQTRPKIIVIEIGTKPQ